jgi:hypothetical protein
MYGDRETAHVARFPPVGRLGERRYAHIPKNTRHFVWFPFIMDRVERGGRSDVKINDLPVEQRAREMNKIRSKDKAASLRALTKGKLETILEKHETWMGSGWELGQRADLHGKDLHDLNFQGAFLADADLHRADLHCVDLRRAELDGADLHCADLHCADLHEAVLEWADLHRADLHEADLQGALLREADLHQADLHGADLREADLLHADLRGADLTRVKGLTQTQLNAALGDATTRLPSGLTVSGDEGADA